MRCVINSSKGMSHRVCNAKTYIREAHSSNILTKSHFLLAFRLSIYRSSERACNDLNSFEMEHICHLPGSFCCVSLDSMCKSIHSSCCCKALWHCCHHIRINNCDNCLYLGGQDVETARYIAAKANKTADTILNMPLEQAYLFTRGQKPRLVVKYDLHTHEAYGELPEAAGEKGGEAL